MGEGLDEVELSPLTDLLHDPDNRCMIDGVLQLIGDKRTLDVGFHLDIDLEALRCFPLGLEHAVSRLEVDALNGKPDGVRPAALRLRLHIHHVTLRQRLSPPTSEADLRQSG